MNRVTFVWLGMVLLTRSVWGEPFADLARDYTQSTQPLLSRFCLGCHSTEKQEGELDLERFSTWDQVRMAPQVWQKVAEMLDNGEMPPRDAVQPAPHERKALRGWIEQYLHAEALAGAGDPGPVVLRRLSNAEYTYTVQDLTGIPLDPAREFPADGAAGEGFTNTGNSLVMSPSLLTKYLDAAKGIAEHAELLPTGFRFSPSTSRDDWTQNGLQSIREFYARHADTAPVPADLQARLLTHVDGGRIPYERYLAVTLQERAALRTGEKSLSAVAQEHHLHLPYLRQLWSKLNAATDAEPLRSFQAKWESASPQDVLPLLSEIGPWQRALWRFTTVGHIGRAGGPTAWQEPVDPIVQQQEVRFKFDVPDNQADVTLYLSTEDAGDGGAHDDVVWQQPRLIAPGRPPLLLRDLRGFVSAMTERRNAVFSSTARVLTAIDSLRTGPQPLDIPKAAAAHQIDADSLAAWLQYLGIGADISSSLNHMTTPLNQVGGYDFVKGWGSSETPLIVANSSDNEVRVPGVMKGHGVAVHPSPTLQMAIGWQSPLSGQVHVTAQVMRAHPECGNGVTWSLEMRRGTTRESLAQGTAEGRDEIQIGPLKQLEVQSGDLISLLIGPRDGNHSCDLTAVDLQIQGVTDSAQNWHLSRDVAPDIQAGNPHADIRGNATIWHFYTEPVQREGSGATVPAGSLVAKWQAAETMAERSELAQQLQRLLQQGPAADAPEDHPDTLLYRQLSLLGGPLLVRAWNASHATAISGNGTHDYGLPREQFGRHPSGAERDPACLCLQAPQELAIRIPAELARGAEFVAQVQLDPDTGALGSVQVRAGLSALGHASLSPHAPILLGSDADTRHRFNQAVDTFRQLFPPVVCYTRIVPVDEAVTLTLFHREDSLLRTLLLESDDAQRLEDLWTEFHFVSHDALKLVNAYEQITEFATQDRPDMVIALAPMREPIQQRAAQFRESLVTAEPQQVNRLIAFAGLAYRRPLIASEEQALRTLYSSLRAQSLPHDEAFRFVLARILIAPSFLYRLEIAPEGTKASPVTDWELANRLSYFLWASQPDTELRKVAMDGSLHEPDVLRSQAHRMLQDTRVRRLAKEFACQWLHVYDFDTLNEKSEKYFPEFEALRGDMYEETIRLFADLFQADRSILTLLNADHTFVNARLAAFYGIPGVTGTDWQRVDGLSEYGRGGILGLATTLAKQSGASRTSPILRGNWVSEVLLGEKLPKPPKQVPILPDDEASTNGLTVRQLVARHTTDIKCQGCHQKIDPFGFALESYDAIGRRRDTDLGNRPIDTKTTLPDGRDIDGLPGLRSYLITQRQSDFVRQFCRKLLGYALGRGVQLSDQPLLTEMQDQLASHDYRFWVAIDTIVNSRQFREIRGRASEHSTNDSPTCQTD